MDPDTRFQPTEGRTAARVIDGEAILIDLVDGNYYSIADVGSIIWQMIEARWTLGDIGLAVSERFGVGQDRVDADIKVFVDALLDEQLIEISRETSARADSPLDGGSNPPYAKPEFTAYRDIAKLLALDPPTPGGAQEFLWRDPDGNDTNGSTP